METLQADKTTSIVKLDNGEYALQIRLGKWELDNAKQAANDIIYTHNYANRIINADIKKAKEKKENASDI